VNPIVRRDRQPGPASRKPRASAEMGHDDAALASEGARSGQTPRRLYSVGHGHEKA